MSMPIWWLNEGLILTAELRCHIIEVYPTEEQNRLLIILDLEFLSPNVSTVKDTENQNSKTGVNVRVEEPYLVPRKNIKRIDERSL